MPDARVAALTNEKYLSLTTYRKDGRAVPTAVWFAVDGDELLVYTGAQSGKVKRIRNNVEVTVAPCDRSGKVSNEAFPATARLLPASDAARVTRLLNKKYGLAKRLIAAVQWIGRTVLRRKNAGNAYLAITPTA